MPLQAGDIIVYDDHVGIYNPGLGGNCMTISVSSITNKVVWNKWGFKPGPEPTIRRCGCDTP